MIRRAVRQATGATPAALLAAVLLASALPAAAGNSGRTAGRDDVGVVVDAAGRVVGVIEVANPLFVTVGLGVGDRLGLVTLDRNAFLLASDLIAFETADCTGPPFVVHEGGTFRPAIRARFGIGPGSVLYAGEGRLQEATLRSFWAPAFPTPAHCMPVAPTPADVLPAVQVLDLLAAFTAPFRFASVPGGGLGVAGKPAGGSTVVNADGHRIGTFLSVAEGDAVAVAIELGSLTALPFLTGDRIFTSFAPVVFQSTNCSGPAFLVSLVLLGVGLTPFFDNLGVGPGNQLFGPAGAPRSQTIESTWNPAAPTPCQPLSPAQTLDLLPAVPVLDLATLGGDFRLR